MCVLSVRSVVVQYKEVPVEKEVIVEKVVVKEVEVSFLSNTTAGFCSILYCRIIFYSAVKSSERPPCVPRLQLCSLSTYPLHAEEEEEDCQRAQQQRCSVST